MTQLYLYKYMISTEQCLTAKADDDSNIFGIFIDTISPNITLDGSAIPCTKTLLIHRRALW